MTDTFAEFIDEKGVQSLQVATGALANTVYGWRFRNLIPRQHWPELIAAYDDISLAHLKRWEAAYKPRQRQSA